MLVVLGFAGVAGLAALDLIIRRSAAGAALVMGVSVAAVAWPTPIQVSLGPLTVFLTDVAAGLLAVATVARFLRAPRLTRPQWLLLAVGAVAVLSLARGVLAFGVEPAVNEFRRWLALLAGALYFSTVEPVRAWYDRIALVWLAGVAALVALALLRWAALAVGVSGGILGEGGSVRVLDAAQALVIAQAFFVVLPWWRRHESPYLRHAAPALLAVVVLLQHRTVWAVLVAGVALLAVRRGALDRQVVAMVGVSLLLGALLGLLLLDGADVTLTEQLSGSATNADTFLWRYEGWAELLQRAGQDGGLVGRIIGLPIGSGWRRFVEGGYVEVSPHNFYLETYLRLGAVGLAALVALLALTLRTRLRDPGPAAGAAAAGHDPVDGSGPGGLLGNDVLLVLTVSMLVFWITYAPDLTQALLLGLVTAAVPAARPAQPAVHAPEPVEVRT